LLNIDKNTSDLNNARFIRDKQSGELTGLLLRQR